MSVVYENECGGCPPEIGCLGDSCPYRHVPHYYCDICGEECSTLYVDKFGDVVGCDNCISEKEPEEVMVD